MLPSIIMTLYKINIGIGYASNPALRNLVHSPEAFKELEPYLRGIVASGPEYHQNEIVSIDLTGSDDALSNFKRNVLDGREAPEVYTPFYLEDQLHDELISASLDS